MEMLCVALSREATAATEKPEQGCLSSGEA